MASKTYGTKKFYKINQYITYPTIRLLSEDGRQIGVVSIDEARRQSATTGLDLVEITGNAKPPVIKLIDFSKFRYQESKKQKAEKKGQKGGETKEIQMTPFIGAGDYETRLKKAQKFLSTGNKVKLVIKFQGRQITKKEFGFNLVDKFKTDLQELGTLEGEPKLMGKRLMVGITPVKLKKIKSDYEKAKQETEN